MKPVIAAATPSAAVLAARAATTCLWNARRAAAMSAGVTGVCRSFL